MPLSDGAVTWAVSRRIYPDRLADFEMWITGISADALKFEGHLGVGVVRTPPEYTLIFRFDSYPHFQAWYHSSTRQQWLAQAAPLIEGAVHEQLASGLEFWFTPSTASQVSNFKAPAPYKMVLLTTAVLAPLSWLLHQLLDPLVQRWPSWLILIFFPFITVMLMTYLIMPRVSRWFGAWLYPKKPKIAQ